MKSKCEVVTFRDFLAFCKS